MKTTTYNGWTNYETWCAALWQDNEQGSYEYAREMAAYWCKEEPEKHHAINGLMRMLKENFEEHCPLLGDCSVFADLMLAAISEINWHEIAENLIEEITE